ncbi:MAG: peptide chain release factor N(5)-glutamine methyltransferase [Pseudomonadales bacterium]
MTETLEAWVERHAGLPRHERETLLCQRLGVSRASLIAAPRQAIEGPALERLNDDARRLAAGEPLAYVLGEWGFWDFELTVTPDVLIPRPETETLVEQAMARIRSGDRVLDLGTGSGAIAIALARATPARVVAVDASAAALAVARCNARRLAASVTFTESDWFSNVRGRYQIIVANPPYVAAGDAHLPALIHEPTQALVGGADGLADLTRIIREAPTYLCNDGWLLVEHGYDQTAPVRDLFRAAGFESVDLVRDLGGQPRVTLGRHPGKDEWT